MTRRYRPRGSGGLRQRVTRDWEASYTDSDGKRRFIVRAKKADAVAALKEALRRRDMGLDYTKQTVEDFLRHWLREVAANRLRPRSLERYTGLVEKHAIPQIGSHLLTSLSPQHLSGLYAAEIAKGLSPASVKFLHIVLHAALKEAVRWNLIGRNPADAVSPPRAKRPEIRVLSPDECRAFLEAVSGDPLEALYVLALTTGMRLGELLGLRWSEVDLSERRVEVRHTLTRIKVKDEYQWHLSEPKTTRSRRSVRLTQRGVDALRAYKARQNAQRVVAGPGWGHHDLIFTDQWGEPLRGGHVTARHLKPLLEAHGLPSVTTHSLRHSYATLQLAAGTNAKVVQEALGHSNVQITLSVYSHVVEGMQKEAAVRMQAMLG